MFNHPFGFNAGPPKWEPPLEGITIREAVHSLLANIPAVDTLAGGRVTPGGRTQGAPLPAVTYALASRWDSRVWGGSIRLNSVRARISAWSTREAEAETLADAIRERFVDFAGLVGQVRIEDCQIANEIDLPEPPASGTGEHIYRVLLDFTIQYRVV